MAELVVSGTDTVKLIRPQAQIARAQAAVTAFVGRALKGPVNQPVTIGSFDDYQRIFGGLCQPSTLSYAVEQYFDNGGGECVVVRVCKGGRAPTLRLPAGAAALMLIGVAPGTREFLRASVDYDGIPADQADRFTRGHIEADIFQDMNACRARAQREIDVGDGDGVRPEAGQ